jgi:uncharacterized protein YihD (DUF1040 family)
MSSPKIDKWVEKNPESWSTLAQNTKKKETFASFKKKFKKGAKEKGKYEQVKHMTDAQLKKIYEASGLATKTHLGGKQKTKEKAFKTKKITVKRKGKTYIRTVAPRWEKNTRLALQLVANLKPRSKEYNQYVANLVESTGRTRQAVIKKIYRTRTKKQ